MFWNNSFIGLKLFKKTAVSDNHGLGIWPSTVPKSLAQKAVNKLCL